MTPISNDHLNADQNGFRKSRPRNTRRTNYRNLTMKADDDGKPPGAILPDKAFYRILRYIPLKKAKAMAFSFDVGLHLFA